MELTIKLKDKTYYSLKDFASDIYLNTEEAFTLVKSAKFLKILYKMEPILYNSIAELLSSPFQVDSLMFKVQYLINPLSSLSYHKVIYPNFQKLGEKILKMAPECDIYLKDFLKYHLLSFYMEQTKIDVKDPTLYRKVKQLEEEFLQNENRAYFKLGFLLEGTKRIFYQRNVFNNPQDFLAYAIQGVNIIDFGKTFEPSQYLFAYLEYLGYDSQIKKYESIVHLARQKEVENDNLRKV